MSEIDRPQFTLEVEVLFRKHSRLVYKTACVVTGNPEDAEDVLQTIFLRLTRAVPATLYKNPAGYLYRAAVNISLNRIRFRRRQVLTADFQFLDIAQGSPGSNVDEATVKRLHEAISTLSPRTVEILILRYVHDYTEPEIAKLLGRARSTIAVTLFRARNWLRTLLVARSNGEKK
jgi:RNA polymerase sigma-70 factor (ECF subfamily)